MVKRNAIFIRTAAKPDCNKIRATLEGHSESEFYDCTTEVKEFATKSFSEDDEVVITIDPTDGLNVIVKVEKSDVGVKSEEKVVEPEKKPESEPATKSTSEPKTRPEPVPEPKKPTVDCNQGKPASKIPKDFIGAQYQKELTLKSANRVLKLSVFQSCCTALQSVQGIDLNNVSDVLFSLYNKAVLELNKDNK